MCYLYMVPCQIPGSDLSLVLSFDFDLTGDAIIEAPVAGDYGWGPVDQVVKPKDGVPAHGV